MDTRIAAATCTMMMALCYSLCAQAGDDAAATTPEPTGASSGTDTLETVMVTARRREENLEQVPASITALDPQQLAERGIVSQSDLQFSVPGLTVRQTQGRIP
jgi:iron complex outermembrane receptor protein